MKKSWMFNSIAHSPVNILNWTTVDVDIQDLIDTAFS